MRKLIFLFLSLSMAISGFSQSTVKKYYDETIDPNAQITEAIGKASREGKYVLCQLGGNWCKWCIRFAKFIEGDEDLKTLVDENFVYIHVNYNPRSASQGDDAATKEMLARLGNASRFGYPALVVLDDKGNVVHIQDSSFLESGEGYDKGKVSRFLKNWTPAVVKGNK